jgi:hypothetical protein
MDYKRIYDKIIENRKLNPIEETEYGEKHHIIPRSLGGSDDSENLVRLTAREHFICHALLAEMYERETFEWYKMNHAFMMMKWASDNQHRYINSRLYELKRKYFSISNSWKQSGERNSQYGKQRSEETKNKIRKSLFKTLNNVDGLNAKERQVIKMLGDKETHTINGVYINKQRRIKIKKVFNIELENRCIEGYNELYELLYKFYVIEQKSTIEIATIFNTSTRFILDYLIFLNIDRRTVSESLKNYTDKKIMGLKLT